MRTDFEDFREEEELLEDDDEPRSIFAAGWFRAVLALTVLTVGVVVALPYLLEWFEPASTTKAVQQPTAGADLAAPPSTPSPTPAQPTPSVTATAPANAPAPAPTLAKPRPATSAGGGSPRAASSATRPSLPPPPVRTPVETERVSLPSVKTAELKPGAPGGHWVQVGVFKDAGNADALARKVRLEGFPVQVARVKRDEGAGGGSGAASGSYLLVRAGGFPDRSAAVSARAALSAKGYPGFLTEGSAK